MSPRRYRHTSRSTGFNLGGYRPAAFDAGTPNRIELGGLTDTTFRLIPLIEAGRNTDWPF